MRRRIALALFALCGALAALLATATTASAHPLGNFTVNRYAGIEVAGSDVYVRYALDLAEIPTYQLGIGDSAGLAIRRFLRGTSC